MPDASLTDDPNGAAAELEDDVDVDEEAVAPRRFEPRPKAWDGLGLQANISKIPRWMPCLELCACFFGARAVALRGAGVANADCDWENGDAGTDRDPWLWLGALD